MRDLASPFSLKSSLDGILEEVNVAAGPGSDGFGLVLQLMAHEESFDFVGISLVVLIVTARNADTEGKVPSLLVKVDFNDGARGQDPFCQGRISVSSGVRVGMGGQQVAIGPSTVGRLILDHDRAILVHIDAKMNVADSLERVVLEDNIAAPWVATKDEAGRRVVEPG